MTKEKEESKKIIQFKKEDDGKEDDGKEVMEEDKKEENEGY